MSQVHLLLTRRVSRQEVLLELASKQGALRQPVRPQRPVAQMASEQKVLTQQVGSQKTSAPLVLPARQRQGVVLWAWWLFLVLRNWNRLELLFWENPPPAV